VQNAGWKEEYPMVLNEGRPPSTEEGGGAKVDGDEVVKFDRPRVYDKCTGEFCNAHFFPWGESEEGMSI
jgi:hypothetical protein